MEIPKSYAELRQAPLKLAMSLTLADRGIGPKELSRAIVAVTEASAEDGEVE